MVHKLETPKRQITAMIREDIVIDLKTLLLDPTTGRTKYGSMSILLERLLSDFLDEVRRTEGQSPKLQEAIEAEYEEITQ